MVVVGFTDITVGMAEPTRKHFYPLPSPAAVARTTPFGAAARDGAIRELGTEAFDVLVVGGGITGAGIARDAALRGVRVALVEAEDFASGTSSKSSRLVHGGLRYLRQGHLRLVWEACHERATLHDLAPHLVRPITMLLPAYGGRGGGYWSTVLGLWVYDRLAGRRGMGGHRRLGPRETRALEPNLNPQGLLGAGVFRDCTVDDARLVLLNARSAWREGACVVPRCPIVGLRWREGRVEGVRVRDGGSGREFDVRARLVVGAVGPWADVLGAMAKVDGKVLRPTKGTHLVLERERLGHSHAMALWNPEDGRLFFLIPWGSLTVVGTTDTAYEGDPRDAQATREDVEYLLRALNALLPGRKIGWEDVRATYAGVRPLAWSDDRTAGAIPREHRILRPAPGLMLVCGGKLTTYRSMAEKAVDGAVRDLGFGKGPCRSARVPLQERLEGPDLDALRTKAPLPLDVVDHLVERHGAHAVTLIEGAVRKGLEGRLVPGLPYIEAEVVEAAEEEMVLHLEDFMERRTHLALEALDRGVKAAPRIAALLGGVLGWTPERAAEEVETYRGWAASSEGWRKKLG